MVLGVFFTSLLFVCFSQVFPLQYQQQALIPGIPQTPGLLVARCKLSRQHQAFFRNVLLCRMFFFYITNLC